jgi:hypothetical protein
LLFILLKPVLYLKHFPKLKNYITNQWLQSFQDLKVISKPYLLQLHIHLKTLPVRTGRALFIAFHCGTNRPSPFYRFQKNTIHNKKV